MWKQWEDELLTARNCRSALYDRGIDDVHRKWLARLVSTRRIIILPTANALGYYHKRRLENNKDPNRDFPYDLKDNTACMTTIAARTINELFREHIFQLALTFHAGTTAIGYEWGAPHYSGMLSPDHLAQDDIAQGYSRYSGKLPAAFNPIPSYPVGTMNDIVYPVRGGMEDWAYASSWDLKRSNTCHPDTFGGYAASKTNYNNATLRAFNMLVETSKLKTPDKYMLGSDWEVLKKDQGEGMGHISRNIRLALMAVEVVEPYISIVSVENKYLQDDVVPHRKRTDRTCMKDRAATVPQTGIVLENEGTFIEWTIGGAFRVNETGVLYGKWEDMPASFDGSMQPTIDDLEKFHSSTVKRVLLHETHHNTRWSSAFEEDIISNSDPHIFGPSFSITIDLHEFDVGDRIVVMAYAIVDQSWVNMPVNKVYGPHHKPPQSHIANVRTNPDWFFESFGKAVQGRLSWFSPPLTLNVKNSTSKTIETSMRLAHDFLMAKDSDHTLVDLVEDKGIKLEDLFVENQLVILVGIAIFLSVCLMCCALWKPSGTKFHELDTEEKNEARVGYVDEISLEEGDHDREYINDKEEKSEVELTAHKIT